MGKVIKMSEIDIGEGELFLKIGLYQSIEIDYARDEEIKYTDEDDNGHILYETLSIYCSKDYKAFIRFLTQDTSFNAYCPYCEKLVTLQSEGVESLRSSEAGNVTILSGDCNEIENADIESVVYAIKRNKAEKLKSLFSHLRGRSQYVPVYFRKSIKCALKKHEIVFFFYLEYNESNDVMILTKVGQNPSMADLYSGDKLKYKTVLDNDMYLEYTKALGLYAHGVGIGSFTYLRRIIEKLTYNIYEENKAQIHITETNFDKLRLKERIDALKGFLPDILVREKNIYEILSKGIHELDEDECNRAFSVLKTGIDLILDDILAMKDRKEKEEQLNKDIAEMTSKYRNKTKADK